MWVMLIDQDICMQVMQCNYSCLMRSIGCIGAVMLPEADFAGANRHTAFVDATHPE